MTTITSTDLRNKSIGLYTPPFRFEHGYIWDAKGQMVADNHVDGEDAALRIRGWGRISYMENPEALQDEVGNVIALAMTEFWERRKAAAKTITLPAPACTYADHSYPAYTKQQVLTILESLGVTVVEEDV